jgi:ElaB/YqjD/DUF883 family membrane-anchored ribosome-binding protein
MASTAQSSESRDKLVDDLKSVIQGAEELLKNTGQQADESYRSARSRFESTLKSAKTGLSSLEDSVVARTKDTVQNTDQYVQSHPWQSVGIGAFAGLVFGLMIGRK